MHDGVKACAAAKSQNSPPTSQQRHSSTRKQATPSARHRPPPLITKNRPPLTHKVPGRDHVRFDPAVLRRTLAAEIRHLVHVSGGEANSARHAGPHREAVLADGGRGNAAARHVVAKVAGRKDQQVFRILKCTQQNRLAARETGGGRRVGGGVVFQIFYALAVLPIDHALRVFPK